MQRTRGNAVYVFLADRNCVSSIRCLPWIGIGFTLGLLVTHIPRVCMSTFPKARVWMEKFFTYGLYLYG